MPSYDAVLAQGIVRASIEGLWVHVFPIVQTPPWCGAALDDLADVVRLHHDCGVDVTLLHVQSPVR